jgi:hypothetical protein
MSSQWRSVIFWVSAIVLMVTATMLYEPAAARTGSLLVWTNNRLYVMDIDTLTLERVAPAEPGEPVSVSPGCNGVADAPCRVLVGQRLYHVDVGAGGSHATESALPVPDGLRWRGAATSWSPDGQHLAYGLYNESTDAFDLQVLDAASGKIVLRANDIDPDVAVAWAAGCADGFNLESCKIGYKKMPGQKGKGFLATLIGYTPATQAVEQWSISPEPIFELQWASDDVLLYSRPKRHFIRADDHEPAYVMPSGAQLANLSPNSEYTVYYQPFTLEGCPAEADTNNCLNLGVWLQNNADDNQSLIYNLAVNNQQGGLNFIPIWSPFGNQFVFFQDGQLINYDLTQEEATIWYKGLSGKLRSAPIFSPNEEAVAFVDSEGQGFSNYRLLVINPRLQPVEHIIQTETGFRVLAWLPN